MSNWLYANEVPTETWRSAMTLVRELQMMPCDDGWRLSSEPVHELLQFFPAEEQFFIQNFSNPFVYHLKNAQAGGSTAIRLSGKDLESFQVILSNNENEKMIIGFDENEQEFFIDRRLSGDTAFHPVFASRSTAPRFIKQNVVEMTIVMDRMSIELFADGGRTAMTAICFPSKPYSRLEIKSSQPKGTANLAIRR